MSSVWPSSGVACPTHCINTSSTISQHKKATYLEVNEAGIREGGKFEIAQNRARHEGTNLGGLQGFGSADYSGGRTRTSGETLIVHSFPCRPRQLPPPIALSSKTYSRSGYKLIDGRANFGVQIKLERAYDTL